MQRNGRGGKRAGRERVRDELAEIRNQLAQLQLGARGTGGRGRSRSRSRGGRSGRSRSASARRVLPGAVGMVEGNRVDAHCQLARKELLATVVVSAGKGSAVVKKYIGPDTKNPTAQMPWLATLAKSFQRWRCTKARIQWQPFVGTTRDGSLAMGIDWTNDLTTSAKVGQIVSLTPSLQTPLWESAQLVLPKAKLMSRRWYDICEDGAWSVDKFVATLAAIVQVPVEQAEREVGALWIDYVVELEGARSAVE